MKPNRNAAQCMHWLFSPCVSFEQFRMWKNSIFRNGKQASTGSAENAFANANVNECYCTMAQKSKDQEHHISVHQHPVECKRKEYTVKRWSMLTMYRPLHYLIVCYLLHACVRTHTRVSICVLDVFFFSLACFRCHFGTFFFVRSFVYTHKRVFVKWFLRCCYHHTRAYTVNTQNYVAADKLKWHYNSVFFICVSLSLSLFRVIVDFAFFIQLLTEICWYI